MTTDAAEQGAAPAPVRIRIVSKDRPWTWLEAGWRDLMASPSIGFFYGAAFVAAGWALVLLLIMMDALWAVLPAVAGFFLVGPILAAGLYDTSRRRERGEPVSLATAFSAFRQNRTQLALMGVLLLVINLFWVRMAGLIFMLFFGVNFSPSLEALPLAILRSDQLVPFLIIGTGVGFVLATMAFAMSAVAIPMLVDRDVSAIEAVVISIRATLDNWRAMAFWAGLIVVFTAMALVPFFLGLAVVLPLVGHATWHAYRDLIR
jgi:uncharacterized membrane protein